MAGKDSEFDKWIDQALEDYTRPYDENVSRRIRAGTFDRIEHWRNRRRRVRFFTLAGALTFACALAVALLFRLPGSVQPPPESHATANLKPPAIDYTPAEIRPDRVNIRHVAPVRRNAVPKAAPPKLEQFPAPSPLSAEEQAMVAFAGHTPLTPQQVEQWKPRSSAPLQIPALETDALQIAALQSKPVVDAQ